ncbi:MAG: epoxyqueuosine reductase [Fibrobacteres bacterium]|nr:epoxyqueuosine reductase [Fibrobacterota bacterium]
MTASLEGVSKVLLNLYHATGADRFFAEPLIGIASAEDALFSRYKSIIGDFHWTPIEALQKENPSAKASSVIVWILPVNEHARKANRLEKENPSHAWAEMRSFGELANEQMRLQLSKVLTAAGFASIAPHLQQKKLGIKFDQLGHASYWSERHAAFAAGLGTFGLSAGLITEAGIAVRIGSVVTEMAMPPSIRSYGDEPYAWCTMCMACKRRCPVAAVGNTPAERNKKRCNVHIDIEISENRAERYGWIDFELGCGLCQTKVPCENRRP